MKCLQFTHLDDMCELDIELKNKKIENVLSKYSNFDQIVESIYEWKYENMTIICYGNKDNSDLPVNLHKLPIDDSNNLYGDIFIIAKINRSYCDFDITQYAVFSCFIQEKFLGKSSEYLLMRKI